MPIFATTTELMPQQEAAVAKLLPSRVGALFMEMGTGKSLTIIELAHIRAAKWDRFIWFCPVSLKETVRQEILKHTDIDGDQIYVFDGRTNERNLSLDRVFYVVGIESMAASNRVVLAVNKLVTNQSFVIVDESSYIKSPRALRTERITGIASRAKYRAILTGTPFSQGVVDLYSQMKFLSPKILGYNSFWTFAANHLEYETVKDERGNKRSTGHIIRSHNHGYLAEKIAPYIYQVKKSECLTLPDKLYENFTCTLTREQEDLYKEAKEYFLSLKEPDDWKPYWLFRLFTALQTITCGFWNRGGGDVCTVDHQRLDTLMSAVNEVPDGDKVIIWAKYRRCVEDIMEWLSDEYGGAEVCRYDGMLSERQRGAELERWRRSGRFLVATQSAGGHGLTLNESHYAIFYADSFKYAERAQAEDRNHRIGQAVSPTYASISATGTIDDRIASALACKGNALRMFQEKVDAVRGQGMKESALKLVRGL